MIYDEGTILKRAQRFGSGFKYLIIKERISEVNEGADNTSEYRVSVWHSGEADEECNMERADTTYSARDTENWAERDAVSEIPPEDIRDSSAPTDIRLQAAVVA